MALKTSRADDKVLLSDQRLQQCHESAGARWNCCKFHGSRTVPLGKQSQNGAHPSELNEGMYGRFCRDPFLNSGNYMAVSLAKRRAAVRQRRFEDDNAFARLRHLSPIEWAGPDRP